MTIRVAVLTVSDRSSKGIREDQSGPLLQKLIRDAGWNVVAVAIVPDEIEEIKIKLLDWCKNGKIHLILTTGGTGFSPRDVTPEATGEVIERETPGIPEAMRSASLKITPHAMLSRAKAGVRGNTLIVNMPGSPKAVQENFEVICPVLPHAVSLMLNETDAESSHQFR